jgi:hypothetical protein
MDLQYLSDSISSAFSLTSHNNKNVVTETDHTTYSLARKIFEGIILVIARIISGNLLYAYCDLFRAEWQLVFEERVIKNVNPSVDISNLNSNTNQHAAPIEPEKVKELEQSGEPEQPNEIIKQPNPLKVVSTSHSLDSSPFNFIGLIDDIKELVMGHMNCQMLGRFVCTSKSTYLIGIELLLVLENEKPTAMTIEQTKESIKAKNANKITAFQLKDGLWKYCDNDFSELFSIFPNIQHFKANSKILSDSGLSTLTKLTNLKSLDLSGCLNQVDNLPAHLSVLTSLENLNLNGDFSSSDFTHIAEHHRYSNWISDDQLACLSGLINLQQLDLGKGGFTDGGLVHLRVFSNLKSLNLNGCSDLTDGGLINLGSSTNLQRLDLKETKLKGSGLKHLSQLTNLRQLDLSLSDTLEDDALVHINNFYNLEKLNLGLCKLLTDIALIHLNGLTSLVELNLNCTNVTDNGLTHLKGMTNLKKLNLEFCNNVTKEGLASFREENPSFNHVEISHFRFVLKTL